MAIKVDGTKKKAKVSRDPLFLDEKYTGVEPVWDYDRALEFSEEVFDSHLRKSLRYYNYFYGVKDLKKYLVQWLREYSDLHKTFDKATVDKYAKSSDGLTPFTACAIVKAHTQGMPLREKHVNYLLSTVRKVLSETVEVTEEVKAEVKTAVKAPTIQDRLNEKMSEVLGEFEGHYDDVVEGKKTTFKAFDFLTANNVPQAQLSKFEKNIQTKVDELAAVQSKDDEQLTEAYSHWKAADFKRVNAWLDDAIAGIEQYRGVKRAVKKARVRKPPAKEKQVAKLKYMKNDAVNKLVSVNPVDIIGAQVLWVYNTKTRKLGKYVAEDHGGALGVKGSSITGFNESASVQKTLRKPEVQLKEFNAAGKVQLRKFLEDIKAVEVKLNGRISPDTVLLKVQ